jgi:hypothetical protein
VFWDKTNKSDKPEKSEILKAKAVKDKYFETKK